jgi:SecD/SecF fusion protein
MLRILRQVARSILLLALVASVAVLLSGHGAADGSTHTACATAPAVSSLELVYRLEAGEEGLTPSTRDEAIEIVCTRLRAIGETEGEVRALANKQIQVLLPQGDSASQTQRSVERIGEAGRLYFYDWEPNLIGPEWRIGGHPGKRPPVGALRNAKREWRAAGRGVKRRANKWLILAGAFPNAYGAVKLASEQKPREHCATCSASTPRFYMFGRSPAHELMAGPFADRAALRNAASSQHLHDGVVLKVPMGTTIVSEQPINGFGDPIAGAEPGWFAFKDNPALNGSDIVRPNQETDEFGRPNVTFGFTGKGRIAFERLTRKIARRGRAAANGPVTVDRAEAFAGHFAVVFDGEVKTRPIINFAENPNGIDGRTGAQISGGFANVKEAQDLATILKIGGLPINMALIRQEILQRRK